jgi:hypothetical protein
VSLWTRRERGCITEVGRTDSLCGGAVIAIFDERCHRRSVVWWQWAFGSGDAVREVLGRNAYSPLELDA